ncbi:PH domain-containing protein [uncultured Clostridium sp.]|uniref:PH domain-containing protein n=1 Tax=uncultured Clostridium sp. TaxID=59620 RepID=UPI0028EF657E|nr:PH domain-containing protein [uncultured Clostridium sp.]
MESFKQIKGKGLPYIIGETILYNLFIIILIFLIDSYELSNLLKVTLIVINIYELHYMLLYNNLIYIIDEEKICIEGIFGLKKDIIKIDSILGYQRTKGDIKGIKLYGYGKTYFALGKSIIDNLGVAKMYVTSNKDIIYIKTEDMIYGISPEDIDRFEKCLLNKGIKSTTWDYSIKRNGNLHKDKKFLLPLIITTIIIVIVTLTPFVLYLLNKLPAKIPLSFDANFNPVKIGTGKQFAFKQMTYGVLNMALLFCMYYVCYFYAKYDKKSAYKFMYIPLLVALIFLIIQGKILFTF